MKNYICLCPNCSNKCDNDDVIVARLEYHHYHNKVKQIKYVCPNCNCKFIISWEVVINET